MKTEDTKGEEGGRERREESDAVREREGEGGGRSRKHETRVYRAARDSPDSELQQRPPTSSKLSGLDDPERDRCCWISRIHIHISAGCHRWHPWTTPTHLLAYGRL